MDTLARTGSARPRSAARRRRCTAARSRSLRFMRANGMLTCGYARLIARWAWLKLRWRGRLQTDGLCFIGPGRDVRDRQGRPRAARPLVLDRPRLEDPRPRGRGRDRREDRDGPGVHDLRLPARLRRARVHRRRPRDADRLRPRRRRGRAARSALQGIYKRDVHVGNNCWIGYGACILRGATVGDNSVIGTSSVVTKDLPANSVSAGLPARILRMRRRAGDASLALSRT